MDFPPFDHAAWLARAWADGPPKHNLGSSGFQNPLLDDLLAGATADDLGFIDLDAGRALRQRIATRHGLDPEQVRITAGTTGANTATLLAAIRPGCNVVAERPTYTPLVAIAQGMGAEVRWVPRGATWDLDKVDAACDDQTAAILCTSPHNPTGHALDGAAFERLGDIAARHGAVVLVDQVYRELTDHALGAACHDAIISTSGFNKCWGAGGLRIGWLVAAATRAAALEDVARTLVMAPPSFGLRMADRLLDHEAACQAALAAHLEAAHAVYRRHARPGWPEPVGLTVFVPVADSQATAERLLEQGIVTVPGELFHAPGFLRLGFGVPIDELDVALAALVSSL